MLRYVVALSLVASTVAFAINWNRHPHLQKAVGEIQGARVQLAEANDMKKTEFGGHRAKAIQLLTKAEREIQAAAAYAESDAP